ncbi:hypothetical protein METP2_02586 [Methanosarcinales archaeon]|nr:hypothetical protein METP2_02586 [Methanosarcinales archaeon]
MSADAGYAGYQIIKLKSTLETSMKVDIEELKKEKKANFKERLDFIDRYVEWIKATPNKVWSKQYKDFIDSSFQKQ